MRRVEIVGAGPAGASAAIAARNHGAAVELYDHSRFPRHKVCGEFLSPEILPLLENLNASTQFQAEAPARITRMSIHLGRASKISRLPEPGYGLSRYALDRLLFEQAIAQN